MDQPIYGTITNYRIGTRTQMSNECLIQFTSVVTVAKASNLIGQKVLWQGEKENHTGKIIGFHGKNGVVRVKFDKGVPGQALGPTVELAS
jgi:large subunit ribosomal protein L35Ae